MRANRVQTGPSTASFSSAEVEGALTCLERASTILKDAPKSFRPIEKPASHLWKAMRIGRLERGVHCLSDAIGDESLLSLNASAPSSTRPLWLRSRFFKSLAPDPAAMQAIDELEAASRFVRQALTSVAAPANDLRLRGAYSALAEDGAVAARTAQYLKEVSHTARVAAAAGMDDFQSRPVEAFAPPCNGDFKEFLKRFSSDVADFHLLLGNMKASLPNTAGAAQSASKPLAAPGPLDSRSTPSDDDAATAADNFEHER